MHRYFQAIAVFVLFTSLARAQCPQGTTPYKSTHTDVGMQIPATCVGLAAGAAASPGASTGTSLGNGTTVLDVSTFPGYPDLSAMTANAIAACVGGACVYDYHGLSNQALAWSSNPTWPVGSEIRVGSMTWKLPHGISIVPKSQTHIHGDLISDHSKAFRIQKQDTSGDYTPVILLAGSPGGVELDHFWIDSTTPSGPLMPVTSVETSVGPTAVYHGTFTGCDADACVGREVGLWGLDRGESNEGFYNVAHSTADTLTVDNDAATSETSPQHPAWQIWSPYAVLSGGWGIASKRGDNFFFNRIHDLSISADLGIALSDGGCDCYNTISDSVFGGKASHGALWFGGNSYSNKLSNLTLNATDQSAIGYMPAYGFAFRERGGGQNEIGHINIENAKFGFYETHVLGNKHTSIYFENDPARTAGVYGQLSNQIIGSASTQNEWPGGIDVTDFSRRPGMNRYATQKSPQPIQPTTYGSIDKTKIPDPVMGVVKPTCAGACVTPWQYFVVQVDLNGHRTKPFAYAPVNNAAALSSSNFNSIGFPGYNFNGYQATQCYDVLVGDTAHSLFTCIPGSSFPVIDNGSFTPQAYTPPARNDTADVLTAGLVNAVEGVQHNGVDLTKRACSISLGDGLHAIPAGTYTRSFQCRNDYGAPFNITGISCASSNAGASTCNASTSASAALLTSPITAGPSFVAGTQAATKTLAPGQWVNVVFVSDGVSIILTLDIQGAI